MNKKTIQSIYDIVDASVGDIEKIDDLADRYNHALDALASVSGICAQALQLEKNTADAKAITHLIIRGTHYMIETIPTITLFNDNVFGASVYVMQGENKELIYRGSDFSDIESHTLIIADVLAGVIE